MCVHWRQARIRSQPQICLLFVCYVLRICSIIKRNYSFHMRCCDVQSARTQSAPSLAGKDGRSPKRTVSPGLAKAEGACGVRLPTVLSRPACVSS